MNDTITTAQARLDAANAVYIPIARALYGFRYNLSISRAANKTARQALINAEARAARPVHAASRALLAAKQELY